jgi:2'-hydroxyisoflavone reductase
MPDRRIFLTQGIAAVGALTLPAAHSDATERQSFGSKPLRLLILGGTGHIGPYFVRAAMERGHQVSVFSRGLTDSDLPTGVEHLLGDRNGNLESIQGRDWDAVLDIATYGPSWVRTLGNALKGRVGHYTFISTISVYKDPAANRITTEASPVLTYQGRADPYSITALGPDYGALKVLCEQQAEKQFSDRTLIIRPAAIAGPSVPQPYIFYWPLRMQRGGEVLAAGDPSTPIQFIDVRDLAEWNIRMIEQRGTGIYNAAGPVPPMNLAELINTARALAPVPPKVTWVTRSWLLMEKDKHLFGGLLFWEFNKGYITGIDNARALAQGLTTRSVTVTLAEGLRWLQRQPPQTDVATLQLRPNGGGFGPVTVTWPVYLAREKALLSKWHEQERKPA